MIRIVINFDPQKGMGIEGPVDNAPLFLGLLELAKHNFMKHIEEQANKRVQLAPANALPPPPPSLG